MAVSFGSANVNAEILLMFPLVTLLEKRMQQFLADVKSPREKRKLLTFYLSIIFTLSLKNDLILVSFLKLKDN